MIQSNKLKKALFVLSGLFIVITSFTPKLNYFEGVIIYEHRYESSNPNIDLADISKRYGTKSEFYFKNGNYKQEFNGTLLKENLFINKDNRVYMQYSTSDTLFFIDCLQPNETIIKSNITYNKDSVLNHAVNVLAIQTNNLYGKPSRIAGYYFDETLKINPDWFKDVKYSSYDKIYAETNSLPLKVINNIGSITITMTAVEIKRQKVADSLFQIAKGRVTVAQKQ